jgi:hypothetical protein
MIGLEIVRIRGFWPLSRCSALAATRLARDQLLWGLAGERGEQAGGLACLLVLKMSLMQFSSDDPAQALVHAMPNT